MTDKVYHSFGRTYRSRAAATAIQYAGGSEGWVVPSDQRLMEDPEGDLATGSLNAFGESHSSSSFDVTIDTGEALVGGAYLARDTTTTVTLDSSTTGQTVYVGWRDSQTDEVVIGKSGEFGSNDPSIPTWTFDTDGSGVTSSTNERNLDNYRISKSNLQDPEVTVNSGNQLTGGGTLGLGDSTTLNVDDGEGSGLDADVLRGNTPDDLVPPGLICIWSGAISEIPSGWFLCDGNNGTPDLRDRFVVGAGNTYTVDETGGAKDVTLTTSEIPSHEHDYTTKNKQNDTASGSDVTRWSGSSNATTSTTGGGGSHENRPPYYALAYMMKA